MKLRNAVFGLAAVGGISALIATHGEEYRIDLGSEKSYADTCANGFSGGLNLLVGPKIVFTNISVDETCKANRALMDVLKTSPEAAIAIMSAQQGLNTKALATVLSCTKQDNQTFVCPPTQAPTPAPGK